MSIAHEPVAPSLCIVVVLGLSGLTLSTVCEEVLLLPWWFGRRNSGESYLLPRVTESMFGLRSEVLYREMGTVCIS